MEYKSEIINFEKEDAESKKRMLGSDKVNIKVFVVHAAEEVNVDNQGINGEGYTISKEQNITGWETDGGHSSYGLTKEDAEYYAKCINEYPRLLSITKQAEKDLEELIFAARYYESDVTVEMINKALQAIRKGD